MNINVSYWLYLRNPREIKEYLRDFGEELVKEIGAGWLGQVELGNDEKKYVSFLLIDSPLSLGEIQERIRRRFEKKMGWESLVVKKA